MPVKSPSRAKRPAARKTKTVAKANVVAKKRIAAKKPAAAKRIVKPKVLGHVVHFYDRIGVAIIELIAPLTVGDVILFKRGEHEHTQKVVSMQVRHEPIGKAKKGDVVGVQTSSPVRDGSLVTLT